MDAAQAQARITRNNMQIDSKSIYELIAAHDTKAMAEGVCYYKGKSDIMERKRYYYDNRGAKIEDATAENHRLVNNWHRLLVDQKVAYQFGKPMVFSVDADTCPGHEEFSEKIDLLLGEAWDDTVAELATNASNKGLEWLHVYIDSKGYFQYVIIPAEEIIPVYDNAHKQSIEGVLRYYKVKVADGDGKNAEGVSKYRVEWWTRNDVTIYIEQDGVFVLDTSEPVNPDKHFAMHGTAQGWSKVPFIEFPNNSMRQTDLESVKSLVDEYDRILSDFANNIAEVQDVITVLKGYEGTNLAEFRHNLRYFKAIKLRPGNDSGVDKLEFHIPTQAKQEILDRLEENIFMFGQGVNTKTDKFGNQPSGASLQFLYTLLDLKASMMERKFRRAIKRLLWFVTEYINLTSGSSFDSQDITVTLRKNMVQNVKEMVDTLKVSRDMISDETIVALHPMIETPTEEYQRLLDQRKAERQSSVNLDNPAWVNIHE